jgi:AhpD family alkylhydroperoxidase
MSRVALHDESTKPDQLELIDRIKQQRGGRLLNLYRVLLNSPPVCEGWLKLFTAIRQQAKLDARYRELAILRVAVINGAPYEHRAHVPHGLKAGLTQAQIDALPAWTVSDAFDPRERAVLAYADAMTRDIRVPGAIVAALKGFLDDRELVELTATVAGYNLVSRFLEAIEVDLEKPSPQAAQ